MAPADLHYIGSDPENDVPLVDGAGDGNVSDVGPRAKASFHRRVVTGALVLLGLVAAAGFVMKRATTPCIQPLDVAGMVSLVETKHGDMDVGLTKGDDPSFITRWLAEKHEENLNEENKEVDELMQQVQAAMKDPDAKSMKDVSELVTKVSVKQLAGIAQQRKGLKEALAKERSASPKTDDKSVEFYHNLEALKNRLKDANKTSKDGIEKSKLGWPYMPYWGGPYVARTEYNFTRRIIQQHYVAFCTFNILNMISHVARLGMDFNDIAKTCPGSRYNRVSHDVCFINAGSALTSVSWVASMLSFAANECAASVIPNIDAQCAGSITGLIGMIAQLATGAALAANSCYPRGSLAKLPYYYKASHAGKIIEPVRRLEEEALIEEMLQNVSMPGRRLLLGGGVGSNYAACAVDITEVAWWLATFSLFINSAANSKTYGTCTRHSFLGNGLAGFCIADIAGAIFAFAQAAAMIQLTIVHCSNELDLPSLCGAGITEILSSIAGMTATIDGIVMACGKYQHAKGTWDSARRFDDFTGGLITRGIGTALDNYGRRLTDTSRRLEATKEFEMYVETTKKQFKDPQDVFTHLGFDNTDAKWRESVDKTFKDPIELFRVDKNSNCKASGLADAEVCK